MTKQNAKDDPTRGAFCRARNPDGPWVLCAKGPDEKGMPARGFSKGQEDEMDSWIEDRLQRKKNIYQHVAVPKAAVNRRLTKDDIAGTRDLHADLDCPDGMVPPPTVGGEYGDPQTEAQGRWMRWYQSTLEILDDEEQVRLLGLPGLPTAVVSSGGGVHVYWGLHELATDFEAVKKRNWQILEALGEKDKSTRDITRLLRVPGTVNYPGDKKI